MTELAGTASHAVRTIWSARSAGPSSGRSSRRPSRPCWPGQDVLLLAPTAGGKTEAAAFPVLSRMAAEGWTGLSVLYLCPLKALLNNLLPRLETYGGWTGRRVALWHGDTAASRRRAILADPPDLLLTTPESLESMLVSANVDHRQAVRGPSGRRRGRGPRVRLRRPRLASAGGPGTADPALRAAAAADRAVRHRRQPGRPAPLAAGILGRETPGHGRRPGGGTGERTASPGSFGINQNEPDLDIQLDYVGTVRERRQGHRGAAPGREAPGVLRLQAPRRAARRRPAGARRDHAPRARLAVPGRAAARRAGVRRRPGLRHRVHLRPGTRRRCRRPRPGHPGQLTASRSRGSCSASAAADGAPAPRGTACSWP